MSAIKKIIDDIQQNIAMRPGEDDYLRGMRTAYEDTIVIVRAHLGDVPLVDARVDKTKPLTCNSCTFPDDDRFCLLHNARWHIRLDVTAAMFEKRRANDCPIKTLNEEEGK